MGINGGIEIAVAAIPSITGLRRVRRFVGVEQRGGGAHALRKASIEEEEEERRIHPWLTCGSLRVSGKTATLFVRTTALCVCN